MEVFVILVCWIVFWNNFVNNVLLIEVVGNVSWIFVK